MWKLLFCILGARYVSCSRRGNVKDARDMFRVYFFFALFPMPFFLLTTKLYRWLAHMFLQCIPSNCFSIEPVNDERSIPARL